MADMQIGSLLKSVVYQQSGNFYQKIMKTQEEENLEELESTNKMAKLFNIIYNLYNGKTLE